MGLVQAIHVVDLVADAHLEEQILFSVLLKVIDGCYRKCPGDISQKCALLLER